MVTKYYQKHKKRLQKEARERYQNLSEEGKDKRRKKSKIDIKMTPKKKNKSYESIWKNII